MCGTCHQLTSHIYLCGHGLVSRPSLGNTSVLPISVWLFASKGFFLMSSAWVVFLSLSLCFVFLLWRQQMGNTKGDKYLGFFNVTAGYWAMVERGNTLSSFVACLSLFISHKTPLQYSSFTFFPPWNDSNQRRPWKKGKRICLKCSLDGDAEACTRIMGIICPAFKPVLQWISAGEEKRRPREES